MGVTDRLLSFAGAGGNTNNEGSNTVETGTIAGIASALAMALVGAVSSYISYQQKKFCFSIQRKQPLGGGGISSGGRGDGARSVRGRAGAQQSPAGLCATFRCVEKLRWLQRGVWEAQLQTGREHRLRHQFCFVPYPSKLQRDKVKVGFVFL
ncbi:CD99 antigen-like protein 2 [Aix galericulata]|nr:CD99 antigen-like protein 2 [Aix galericulata]